MNKTARVTNCRISCCCALQVFLAWLLKAVLTLHYNEIKLMFFCETFVLPAIVRLLWKMLSTKSFTALSLSGTPTSRNTVYHDEIGAAHKKLGINIGYLSALTLRYPTATPLLFRMYIIFINQLSTNSNRRCDCNRIVEPSCLLTNLLSKTSILLFQLLKV